MTTTRTRPIARDVELRVADTRVDVDVELTRQLCRWGILDVDTYRDLFLEAFTDAVAPGDADEASELVKVAAAAIQLAAAIRRRPQPLPPPTKADDHHIHATYVYGLPDDPTKAAA